VRRLAKKRAPVLPAEAAQVSFQEVSRHSRQAAGTSGQKSIDLTRKRRRQLRLEEGDRRLRSFLGVFLADAGLLDNEIHEFVHELQKGR
jgi:hypothetical protein